MTDRKDALTELLAKVESGEAVNSRDSSRIWPTGYAHAINANHGSLDAAKALHEAVLPDHRARLDVGKKYRAWIITPDNEKFDAYSSNPARAWLIAILKALISDSKQLPTPTEGE
jgi:hypothetical protein